MLAGCGGGDNDPEKVGETGGLTSYEVAASGFSIGVPLAATVASHTGDFEQSAQSFRID